MQRLAKYPRALWNQNKLTNYSHWPLTIVHTVVMGAWKVYWEWDYNFDWDTRPTPLYHMKISITNKVLIPLRDSELQRSGNDFTNGWHSKIELACGRPINWSHKIKSQPSFVITASEESKYWFTIRISNFDNLVSLAGLNHSQQIWTLGGTK